MVSRRRFWDVIIPFLKIKQKIWVATNSTNDAISDIMFRTGASDTERLRIDDSGNVGIGTTSPSEMLEVAGTVKAQAFVDSSGNSKGAFIDTGTTAYYTNGNVGIGTSSPSGVLDIVGSTAVNPGIELTTADTGNLNIMMKLMGATNTERAIGFYDNETLAWWFGRDNFGDANDGLGFYNGSRAEFSLVMKDSGNVGIGTGSPGAKLEVAGSMIIDGEITKTGITKPSGWGGGLTTYDIYSSATIAVGDSSGTIASYFNNSGKALFGGPLYVGEELGSGETAFTAANENNILAVNGYGTALKWCVYNTNCSYGIGTNTSQLNIFGKNINGINFEVQNNSNAMTIDNNGNVGIGKTSPLAKLHIDADDSNGIIIEDSEQASYGAAIKFRNESQAHYTIGHKGSSFVIAETSSMGASIWNGSNTPEDRLLIDTDGNVGIGISTPGTKLDVNGTVTATDFVKSDGTSISGGAFSLNGTNAYYSAGNVGIGTSSPSAPFHVISSGSTSPHTNGVYVWSDDASKPAMLASRVNGGGSGDPLISLDISGVTGWSIGVDNDNDDKLKFSNDWDQLDNNTAMTIDTNGNVGIGTTSPGEKLVVDGNINVNNMISLEGGHSNPEITFYSGTWGDDIYIGGGGSTVIGSGEFAINADTSNTFTAEDLILGADYEIRFFTNAQTYNSKVEAMTIGTNGNVYISSVLRADGGVYVGDDESIYRAAEDHIRTDDHFDSTASIRAPVYYDYNDTTYYIDPNGSSYLAGNLAMSNNQEISWSANTDLGFIKFISTSDSTGGSYLEIGTRDNSNEPIIFTQSGNERMRVHTNGYVGIGTSSPTQKLHVNGDLKVDGTITATEISGDAAIPSGLISMWSGTIANIPSGWALCNGSNGTPDLRGRFVVGYSGSGDYASIGNTGGSDSRTLTTANMPSHNHSGSIGARDTNHTHSGTSGNNNQNHSHSVNSDGNHRHGINTRQDDWNDSGGDGPSWGDGDNGTYTVHTWNMNYAGSHTHGLGNQSANHTHSFTTGNESTSHSHSLTINSSGSGTAFDNRPAYYVIAFIMKL